MGLSVAAAALQEPRRPHQWSRTVGDWVWITVVSFLATLPVEQLCAFPSSLSDCQTPTGWNCSGFDDRDTDLFLCDTNTCKFDGECLRIGETVTCICNFKVRHCSMFLFSEKCFRKKLHILLFICSGHYEMAYYYCNLIWLYNYFLGGDACLLFFM
ncbi:unnamed protein product [Oncorhynchus mykiss]|uniref:EGF-like domain-containing protein n=1 Tax=Oncorhynchus mykiss TaxID=8022 RepID=A0A060WCL7_ONCMY|nr:unnamed protein product [Oncorhynchus mykiss]